MWHPLPFSQSARQWTLCQPLRLAVGVQILWCTLICSAYSDQNERFFERHVRPILIDHCVGCHGPNVQEGGLRLDTRTGVFQGGDSGPAVMPGQA
ncbi:MAG: c-type cytochrome domain-containing protein, partial [Planctomycetota bacterium]|nr:c-type cytochrome domain-containing protein [Planctomycetota bacterium]